MSMSVMDATLYDVTVRDGIGRDATVRNVTLWDVAVRDVTVREVRLQFSAPAVSQNLFGTLKNVWLAQGVLPGAHGVLVETARETDWGS